MAIPDGSGNVTVSVVFFADPTQDAGDSMRSYQAPGSATLGSVADAVAADQGFPGGGVSLMAVARPGKMPVLEPRATQLQVSAIGQGARCVVVPSG